MASIKKIGFWFITFWLITMWVYKDALGCQFTDDFFAFVLRFEEEGGWKLFWQGYSFHSLYLFNNAVFFGIYQVFCYAAWPWFLLFTGLHALNASLAFGFIRRLFAENKLPFPLVAPLAMALLFLLSPYQTENLIWGGTLNYALCLCSFWAGMWFYADYLQKGGFIRLVAFYLAYILALFSLGIALVLPAVFMVVFCLLWPSHKGFWGHALRIALPMAVFIGLQLWLNHTIKGTYITHYGTATHTQFILGNILTTAWQYMAKLWAYVHFWPGNYRITVYEKLQAPVWYIGLSVLAMLGMALYYLKDRYRATFLLGWVLVMGLMLLPVLNMYFMYYQVGENDRLSYFSSVFVFGLPVLLIVHWGNIRMLIAYLAIISCLNIVLLEPQVDKWKQSAIIQERSMDSPYFYQPGNVYLLNVPNYYQGVYVYRSLTYMQWKRMYQYGLPDVTDKLIPVASANMQSLFDSVSVTALAENQFKVELSAWGNWFSVGTPSDSLSVILDEWNHSYVLTIPNLQPEDKLLYLTPAGWKAVARP